jgi:hypothetical protein
MLVGHSACLGPPNSPDIEIVGTKRAKDLKASTTTIRLEKQNMLLQPVEVFCLGHEAKVS